jgi:dipeptidyl aminopeptidase/acylaminoacyl peptidase
MTRIYLAVMMLAAAFCATPGWAAREAHGPIVFDNIPDAPASLTDKLDAYLSARQATPLGWSPGGGLLIVTRFADVDQLHLVEHAGAARRQLTFLREPVTEGAFSPDAVRGGFAYFSNPEGKENPQLYYQRQGEPDAKLLTDGKSSNCSAVWSNFSHELAFSSTARDGVSRDIAIVDPESGALPRLALSGDGAAWYPLDWSPDDRKLLALKSVSYGESSLYVVELSTGQKHEVDPGPGKVRIADARFSRDGQGVYLISDRDSEFTQLRYVNLFTADKTIISAHIPWDVEQLAISRDGQYLAFVSNEGAVDKLNLVDLHSRQDLTPPKLPADGVISALSFDADGKRLAFGFAANDRPRDAYVLDVATNHLEAWTQSESGPVDARKFVTPRLSKFPSFDQQEGRPRQIPVYIYQPTSPGPHPVLIALEDGPPAQFRPSFDPWYQYLAAELGFAVVAPNLRGASGYGKSYRILGSGLQREDAVKDLGALLVWLNTQPGLDAKHVVVSGDYYGGSLALDGLVNYSERLRGAVAMGAITDFVGFSSNAAPYDQAADRAQFGDERDPDLRAYLRRLSPLSNADRIARPVLVVHGANDARVSIAQSEQMVNTLRSKGGVVWYLQAADEGRAFRKKPDRDAYYQAFAQFLASLR